jgi:hypothetical protein
MDLSPQMKLIHFPDGPREPDVVEFDVIVWLDNHGYDLLANDLHAVIESRFSEISKNDFLSYAARIINATKIDNKDVATQQLQVLQHHWTSFLRIYNGD